MYVHVMGELVTIFGATCSNGCFPPEKVQEMSDLREDCASECDLGDDRAAMRDESNLLEISEASMITRKLSMEIREDMTKTWIK